MSKSTPFHKFHLYGTPIAALLIMSSCGSYQPASYYDDGIYSSGNRVVRVEKRNADAVRAQEQESDRYGEYFGQRADQIGELLDQEVFTDIDGYSSQANDSIPYGEQTDYLAQNNTYSGYPGWGDNPSSISINVYDNSWGWGGLYGFGGMYAWGSPYSWGYGWNRPYYGWGLGWYSPWRYNSWGWAGYYGSWGYPYAWGYGYWNRPYYYSNYYGNYFGSYGRDYAYISGRRGYGNDYIGGSTLLGRSNRTTARRSTSDLRRVNANGTSMASRSRGTYSGSTARRTVNADAVERNTDYRSSRSTRYQPGTTGRSRSSGTYGTSGTSRDNTGYRTQSTRRSSPVYRSSGSRSSRTYRSSGQTAPRSSGYSRPSSSSRSSGTIQRSGSSSRGSATRSSRSSGSSRSGRGGN